MDRPLPDVIIKQWGIENKQRVLKHQYQQHTKQYILKYANLDDLNALAELINQRSTKLAQSI